MEKATITNDVSKTLFINIAMKAYEHERADGILKDQFSPELMGKLDYDFSRFASTGMPGIGVVVRAQYLDEETTAFIKRNKNLVVVHVGAGLDTRFLRINGADRPAVFYELDLPEVMDLREKVLPPAGNERFIKSSMFETAWMDDLAAQHPDGCFLFVIEGVTFYFPEAKIRKLFSYLAERFCGEILCDLLSVWTSKNSKKQDAIKKMKAKFYFGIDDEKQTESWRPRIHHLKTTLLMKRHPARWGFLVGRIMANIPPFKNSSKLVTYGLG